jgi:diguanylate cyclase (GGDEF)-like protein
LENLPSTLIALGLLASSVIPMGIALRLARHQDPRTLAPLLISRARRLGPLFGLLAAISLWVGAYALELLLNDRSLSVWMHRLVFVGVALTPPAVVLTALEATERRPGRSWDRLLWGLLLPVPVVTVLLTLTNDHQALFWAPGELLQVGALSPIGTVHGPWYWVHTAFSYVCMAIGFALLVHHYMGSSRRPSEAPAVAIAFLIPWAANALHVLFGVGSSIDLTPAAFIVTGVLIYRLVRRDILAEVLPIARAKVLETLDDAVLVLDEDDRILDSNRRALAILEELQPELELSPPPCLVDCWPALAALLAEDDPRSRGITIPSATGATRSLELWVTQLPAHNDLGELRAVALRDVTDRRRAEFELIRSAYYDALTGLPNRKRFFDNLGAALRAAGEQGHCLALLLLDLDQFKLVNDTRGHAAGDAVLRTVAAQLLRGIRGSDIVARITPEEQAPEIGRLGGDEFAIVLPRIASAQDAGDVAGRLLNALEEPSEDCPDAADSPSSSASIGIAIFPEDGRDAETLLKHADAALYHAKEHGGNHYQYSHPRLSRVAERRAAIDRELRRAIGSDQLRLVYQPKVRMSGGELTGVEALLRWSNPELGNVPPAEFIPIAEKTGLIRPLGRWVIDQTCRQVRAWRDLGLSVPPVAVNVSSLQLGNPGFLKEFTDSLRRHELRPDALEIEITEHTLLENDESSFVALRDLRAIGVPIALDDFGTGYSALACLNQFDIDVLKIDGSLLAGIDEDRRAFGVVSSLIGLAHVLSMRVVAEGVEREEPAEILNDLGCDEVQGFLYSQPLPPGELSALLRSEITPRLPTTTTKPDQS